MIATFSGGGGGAIGGNIDYQFFFSGVLETGQAELVPVLVKRTATRVSRLDVYLQEAPTGAAVICTFYKNAVSIGTVTVAIGATSGTAAVGPVDFAIDDIASMAITQVGSEYPGKTATGAMRVA